MECSTISGSIRCRIKRESAFKCTSNMASTSSALLPFTSLPVSRSSALSGSKKSACKYNLRNPYRRSLAAQVSLDEEAPLWEPQESTEDSLPQSEQLKELFIDSQRRRLARKLSEANQHSRFLKRQLIARDDDLVNIRSELASLELEIQALVELAEEVASYGAPPSSRKINGKYVQSHLVSRLQAVHEKVKEQKKGVDAVKLRDITLYWVGMAESVKVMGSFDGWSQGEEMSQEFTGAFVKFSTDLRLRPGRYEVKFLVDGVWQLSPELPIVGEGEMKNNILTVE
ncbi:PROTEIN TARGETING TO STARCH (PTST) [Wolffia australiana]